jgi:hypothetical protein
MSPTSIFSKILRFIGIFFMSLTAGFTILGGAGTSCAALLPTKWDSMAPLAPFQWLYILYVIVTVAIGVLGIRAVVKLVKGHKDGYKSVLIALLAGTIIGFLHIYTSRMLRGSSMPVDAVVYTTVLTLVIFLLFRIPPIWKGVDYSKAPRKEKKNTAGVSSIVVGVLCLTIQIFMAPTHTWNGINYADAYQTSMIVAALICFVIGTALIIPVKKVQVALKERIHSL